MAVSPPRPRSPPLNPLRAFDLLLQAAADMRAQAQPRAVHLATLPPIAQRWLLPRLPLLRGRLPEISISVAALESPAKLKRSPTT